MPVVVQILGAVTILAAFALAQLGVVGQRAASYLVLNLVGASVLAADASLKHQWGFLLLEGVWALIAAWGLARARGRPAWLGDR